MTRRYVSLLAGAFTLVAASTEAGAGGFDTPVLYSARHIGIGGTGIASVYDPTALFLNPAGLGRTKFISLTADFSLDTDPVFVGALGTEYVAEKPPSGVAPAGSM